MPCPPTLSKNPQLKNLSLPCTGPSWWHIWFKSVNGFHICYRNQDQNTSLKFLLENLAFAYLRVHEVLATKRNEEVIGPPCVFKIHMEVMLRKGSNRLLERSWSFFISKERFSNIPGIENFCEWNLLGAASSTQLSDKKIRVKIVKRSTVKISSDF
ncbi:hypothetical protein Y1Q_0019885 [Alligator mississippiensis]|uniref:Uncharacterized protein n=1 Tax=Alligator mississippiensis TaxID=8496 RepID=A0A151PFX5_ALLMI|nr:hypothetical protein Y1Q_0019885 [Alligator mississippiensis]